MKFNQQKWIRAVSATLIVTILLVITAPPIRAQYVGAQMKSPDVKQLNVQQLKERVEQLEQTVQELKGQINAIEAGKTTNVPVAGAAAAPNAAPSTASDATTNAQAAALPPPPSTQEPRARAPQDKTNSTTFEAYGFVMTDAGYQFNQNDPNWFDVVRPTKLPSFKDEFAPDGKTFWGVRQTRFGVKSTTPTSFGDLKTIFEFELFGTGVDAGQTTFRLRHAYGELGQFGAGQYWSPFMDIDVFPNIIEYWGPNGMVFFRNVQIRWMPIKGQSRITVALERPGASADQGIYRDRIELQGIRPKFDYPDLSFDARKGGKIGYIQIAGIARSIKWRDVNNDQFDLGGSVFGWGFNLTSNVNFREGTVGKFQLMYGEGVENYMNDAPADVGPVFNFNDPRKPLKGHALPVTGVVAFLDHNWNKQFSSSAGYSFEDIDNSEGQAPNAFHRGHYAIANLLFYPVEKVMMGAEFQYGRRENFSDGFRVNDYRIQFSFKYNFSRVVQF